VYGKKKAPKSEVLLARAYGYSERAIEKLAAGSAVPLRGCSDPKNSDFFSRFRQFEEIEEFLKNRFCQLRKEIGSLGSSCEVLSIGESIENRPIYAVEIRNPEVLKAAKTDGKREKIAIVTGTLHAREWTTTTSVLLSALRVDVTDVSVFFVPVLNPDGYVYTWSGNKQIKKKWASGAVQEELVQARYWRKNRRLNWDGTFGVDLNRNFGSTSRIWGTDAKSKSINLTESDIYQGSKGFSEPETAAIKAYVKRYKKKVIAYFDVHCCIGAILEPFSKEKSAPEYVFDVGQKVIQGINTEAPASEKYEWRPRPASSASGSGISSSWSFQEAKIPFTYVVEIRGKFVMECSEIKPIANEVLAGLTTLLKQLSNMEALIESYKTKPSQVTDGGEIEKRTSSFKSTFVFRKRGPTTGVYYFALISLAGTLAFYLVRKKRVPKKLS